MKKRLPGDTIVVTPKTEHQGGRSQLHAGLDLSRKRLDVCLLCDQGELVEQTQKPA